jgi:hypothetical protein
LSWLKEEVKRRKQWEEKVHQNDQKTKGARQTEHPEVLEMMNLWVLKVMSEGILLTRKVLCQK